MYRNLEAVWDGDSYTIKYCGISVAWVWAYEDDDLTEVEIDDVGFGNACEGYDISPDELQALIEDFCSSLEPIED